LSINQTSLQAVRPTMLTATIKLTINKAVYTEFPHSYRQKNSNTFQDLLGTCQHLTIKTNSSDSLYCTYRV